METLYFNGDVITMEGENDFAEAVLVADGKIKAVGAYADVAAQKRDNCELVDLQGKTLMPGFLDGHGHICNAAAQYGSQAILEDASNFDDIVETLKQFIAERNIPAGTPVMGCLYDHNYLEEGRHPDRFVLDRVSTEHPIWVAHASGHMGVANSLALKLAGTDANTADVDGGFIGRDPETMEPTGYLEESAMGLRGNVFAVETSDPEELLERVQNIYIENGITTVQEGMTLRAYMRQLHNVANKGKLKVDVVAYPTPMDDLTQENVADLLDEYSDIIGEYRNHLKIGGYKILLDGSPQGKTAWMSEPYENSGDYCGYPWLKDEQIHRYVKCAIADNMQLLAHCNGDAASQQYLDVYEAELAAADQPNKNNLRPVMIHCQTVRDDQLDRMVAINMIPSIFVAHTYYWGDVHLKNFGDRRGRRVSPVKSALDRGLIYNFHTDTPIVRPKMLHSVWAAANRITRGGVEIGPEQRVSVYEALKGITINTAYAYFEEDSKGSIKVGKRADLVILDANPLKVDPMTIKDIKVLETIKDGVNIYRAE